MKNGLCIYHANCNDGFAAALAVWKKYGDTWNYFPMQYGDVKDFTDLNRYAPELYKSIMLVDFSLPRPTMENLASITNLLVIDHHKTAKEACEGLDFCKFDLEKSGCELTWEYLFPEDPMPYLFKLIGYRDIGKSFDEQNKHNDLYSPSKKLHCGLQIYQRDFETWNRILENKDMLNAVMSDGFVIYTTQENQKRNFIETWIDNPKLVNIDNHIVPIMNHTDANTASEFIGALSEGYDFAVGYFDAYNKRVFSLRTRKKDIDCGAIAKKFGGGGHPGAAGFSVHLKHLDPEMPPSFFSRTARKFKTIKYKD